MDKIAGAIHDPGGKVRIPLAPDVQSRAEFGGDNNEYRYALERQWDPDKPTVLLVMMNPSTAGIDCDDPSVAKCVKFARSWGYGTLWVGNTFAYRATDQKELVRLFKTKGLYHLAGSSNDLILDRMVLRADLVIMAYGSPHPLLRPHQDAVARRVSWLKPLHVLKLSEKGHRPCHPLYLPDSLKPTPWTPQHPIVR